jgi:hypothetical protein
MKKIFTTALLHLPMLAIAGSLNAGTPAFGSDDKIKSNNDGRTQTAAACNGDLAAPAATGDEVCSGQTAELTATAVETGTTIVWYDAATGGNVVHTGATYSIPNATASATLWAEEVEAACPQNDRTEVTLTVNALPVAVAEADFTVCPGESFFFMPVNITGAPAYSADGGTTNYSPSQPLTITQTTTFTLTVTAQCVNTDQVTVTLSTIPVVVATVSDTMICAGSEVTFTGTGAATYEWDNDVIDGVAFQPDLTVSYIVVGTNADGCVGLADTILVQVLAPSADAGDDFTVCEGESFFFTPVFSGSPAFTSDDVEGSWAPNQPLSLEETAEFMFTVTMWECSVTDNITVTVNPAPEVDVTTTGDLEGCEGDIEVELTAETTEDFEWSNGSTDEMITVTTGGVYTLVATGANGCQDSVTVDVIEHIIDLNIEDLTPAICSNEALVLFADVESDFETTVMWNDTIENNTEVTPTNGATYTVVAEDGFGCSETAEITVTINAAPVVSVTEGTEISVCPGEEVTLTAVAGGSINWDNDVENGEAFTPAASATYTVTAENVNGCVTELEVDVTVYPVITPVTTVSGLTITATPAGMTYEWYNCATNEIINGAEEATFTGEDGESYKVVVTNTTTGCSGTSQCVALGDAAITENTADLGITLFPNPTTGKVSVATSNNELVQVAVYNAQGALVSAFSNVQNGQVIDMTAVEAGIYMIHVATAKGSAVSRIVKN